MLTPAGHSRFKRSPYHRGEDLFEKRSTVERISYGKEDFMLAEEFFCSKVLFTHHDLAAKRATAFLHFGNRITTPTHILMPPKAMDEGHTIMVRTGLQSCASLFKKIRKNTAPAQLGG
jgi:hypothetical protein